MLKRKDKKLLPSAELLRSGQVLYALIYCRVSSEKQAREGHGMEAQKQRCIDFAKQRGYLVQDENIFTDTASGGGNFTSRDGQVKILKLIDKFPHRNFVCIVDDPSRLARDVMAHFTFRDALRVRGVGVESPNFNFEETPEGEMAEGMSAVVSQYQRKANRRQVVQKMKARLERGYWCFSQKKGYDMFKDPIHGKLCKPNKESKVLTLALEGFARGDLPRKIDFCRFLFERGFWKGKYPEKYLDSAGAILSDCFYMGDIEYPKWEISRRKGQHKGIISSAVFQKIQVRLSKPLATTRIRKDITSDFPVRGLVNCVCNQHMTASWSKGRSSRYVYYFCTNRECKFYRKSVPAKLIENGFIDMMKKTRLKDEIGEVIEVVFDRVWKQEVSNLEQREKIQTGQIQDLHNKIRDFTDLVCSAKNDHLRSIYEKRIEEFALQLEQKQRKSAVNIDLSIPYRTALKKVKIILKNPYSIWKKMKLEEQHELFFFIFDWKLSYDPKIGYRTVQTPTAIRLFEEFATSNSVYVDPTGFEPVTSSLQMRRSTN